MIVPPPEFGAAPMPPHVADVAYASATLLEELRESSEEDHLALSNCSGCSCDGTARPEGARAFGVGGLDRRRGAARDGLVRVRRVPTGVLRPM